MSLFSQTGFMPHGHCYLWQPGLISLHVISDSLIGIAYLAISLTLYALIRKIKIPFSMVVLCFGVFIGACGLTHFMEVWTLWFPDYWLSGFVKAITAVASVGTGIYLFRLRHPILTVAEAAKLSEQRRLNLEALTEDLEKRVAERTAELQSSNQKFRTFFELSGAGTAMTDPQTKKFIDANHTFVELTGYSLEELKNLTFSDLTHPDDRTKDSAIYESAVNSNVTHFRSEKRYVRKDGKIIWVNVNGTVLRDANGKAKESMAHILDITERRQFEERLKQSEQNFKSLANSIPQLAWMTDPSGYITWYNNRWYEYTGTTLEQMQGWGWQAVHHPDYSEKVTEKWVWHLKNGIPWEDTFPLKDKNGNYHWFLSRAMPIRDESGHLLHWFGTNTDITEKMQAQDELRKSKEIAENANQAKSLFLANMSHEIRTPLSSVIGYSELLLGTDESDAEKRSYYEIIHRNGRHLLEIVDDLLDISKIESGNLKTEVRDFSLQSMFDDVKSSLAPRAIEKKISLEFELDPSLPHKIRSDRTRLRQILLNLVGNSLKFTEKGSVKIIAQRDQARLKIQVNDTGIGISPALAEKLFKPFTQADDSSTRKYGGTGLGLAISKRLARALGGDLQLKSSDPQIGSTFELVLPLDEN